MSDLLKHVHAVSAILSLSYFLLHAILFRGLKVTVLHIAVWFFKFRTSCVNKRGNTTRHLRLPLSFCSFWSYPTKFLPALLLLHKSWTAHFTTVFMLLLLLPI